MSKFEAEDGLNALINHDTLFPIRKYVQTSRKSECFTYLEDLEHKSRTMIWKIGETVRNFDQKGRNTSILIEFSP